MQNDNDRTIVLRNGNEIPRIGFGCYQLEDPLSSISKALAIGYRYIDTARVYKNEDAVGQAVREAMSVCHSLDGRPRLYSLSGLAVSLAAKST
jgi:diketogulonate reductase-like aldo/keto reductase